ncbi:MAG TPA: endonuclease/exonuclease/phosphatase [Chitinophagales bacterium]|nr:endonuclease/exonuclease/phosphatase [Chitinophagales bacterium]
MNKLLIVLLTILALHATAQEKKYKVGVVAFYNLENLFDTLNDPNKNDDDFTPAGANGYTAKVYEDKIRKLTEVLSQIGTDVSPDGFSILGVAEIENRKVLEDLFAQPEFAKRHYQIVHHEGPDERSIDPAFIYNPKYFKLLSSQSLFVRLENPNGSLHYTRDVLWVSGLYDGEPLHVFVNHWPSRRGGEEASAPGRAAAASVSKKVIDSLMAIDPNTKVIVMGDLNDDPTSPSVAKVLGAKTKIGDVKAGGLYNPWADFLKKGIGTLAYQDSWNLFDQIMISSGFLNKEQNGYFYRGAHIFNRQFMVTPTGKYKGYPMRTYDGIIYNGGYSDHFPTYFVMLKEVK